MSTCYCGDDKLRVESMNETIILDNKEKPTKRALRFDVQLADSWQRKRRFLPPVR